MSPRQKQMESQLPGYRGYGGEQLPQTDLLLRRFLAGRIDEIRDRMATWLANRGPADAGKEKGATTLRTLASLLRQVDPDRERSAPSREFSPEEKERLLDLDLVLLDRVAALEWLVDRLEQAGGPTETTKGLVELDEGIAEAEESFRRRREALFQG